VYFFIYTVRVKGWTFGFSALFGALGRGVGMMKGPFNRKQTTADETKEEK
jgi:ATP-binding cassette subfamily G (WHITE) protein 2 (SNQ2)